MQISYISINFSMIVYYKTFMKKNKEVSLKNYLENLELFSEIKKLK